MIKFKGRSSIKQYQLLKPTKRGYKIWVLAESSTGYVYNFQIYTGKDVVMSLIDGIGLKNRHLFFDNYFTSLQLLHKLRVRKFSATGTIRSDRKYFPAEFKKKKKLKKGEYQYLTCNGVSVIKWMDKKIVFVASNYFDPEVEGEISRRDENGNRKQVSCPLPIVQYNKYMRGVDLTDQNIKYYTIDRKSKRNWLRIFFHFLGMSLVNSYICYKRLSNRNISTALIGSYCSRKRLGRPLAMSNQTKARIEESISSTENSGEVQLLAQMPEVTFLWCRFVCKKMFFFVPSKLCI